MSESFEFTRVLHRWAEVFIHRSMRDFSQFTRDSGLSMPQLNTLMRLHYQGECAVSEIGEHLGVTSAASSQMIHRLVQMGYLERSEDASDRRVKRIALTAQGRNLVKELIDARRVWMQQLTEALTPEERSAIIQALQSLTAAAVRLDQPHSLTAAASRLPAEVLVKE